ncbi:MAG: hypothetical protein K0B15_12285 [Lentimicrobium sp.]|nr:hypothetical protein [Lentimicrobium sp.]
MGSKKVKITLEEALALETELGGFRDQAGAVVMKGLLNQKLSLSKKYHLSNLLKQVSEDRAFVTKEGNKLRNELGTPEQILEIAKNPMHPKNLEYQNQMRELIKNTNREIEVSHVVIDDFETIETDEYYPVFFKILGQL